MNDFPGTLAGGSTYALLNRARFTTPTTGNGLTLVVGSAVPGYTTITGIPDGSQVGYSIEEGVNFETGIGVYHTAAGGTLDRTTVETSSAAGARIVLAGSATVFITITSGMLGGNSMAFAQSNAVAITGGSTTGQIALGLVGGEVGQQASVLEPDFIWSIRDTAGNIAAAIDYAGQFYIGTLISYAGSVSITTDPSIPTGVPSKAYVDNSITALYTNALPLSATTTGSAGTATTFTRSDHRHPSDPTRAPLDAPQITTSITLVGSGETWDAKEVIPEFVWDIADTAGNIALGVDYAGNLVVASMTVGTMTVTSLSVGSAISTPSVTTTLLTISNDKFTDAGMIPDLVGTVRDDVGNVVSGYDSLTGEFNVTSLNIQTGIIKIAGKGLTYSQVPSDAIDITLAPYSAKGDGRDNYTCYVTTSGNTLSVVNYTGTGTLTQVDATTATFSIVGVRHYGWAFQRAHTGQNCYILNTDTSAALYATVLQYRDGQNILLAASDVVAFTNANVIVVCPGFDVTDVGKEILVEGMGREIWWGTGTGSMVTRLSDTITPFGTQTWMGKITTVTDPNHIVVSTTFPFNWTSVATRLVWGTNDGDAIARAARDGYNAGKRRVWFSGSGLYLALYLYASSPGKVSYGNPIPTDPNILLNGIQWWGDGSRVIPMDCGGLVFRNRISRLGSPAHKQVPKRVHGKISFPRCSQLTTVNVLITGDSQGSFDPESQASIVMPASRYIEELLAQNPGITIKVYNIAIGGQTYQAMASPNNLINNNANPVQYWTVPKPVVGTWKYSDFYTNINRTGTGPAIVPDLIICMNCGGNDANTIDMLSFNTVINQMRAIPHGDSFGPTDFILQTDAAARGRANQLVQGGIALPDAYSRFEQWEYATTMQRGVALNRGYPLLDQAPLVERATFGCEVTERIQRAMLQQNLQIPGGGNPGTALAIATQCRDLSFWMKTPGTTDATAWAAIHQLDFTLSWNRGNRLMIRVINGNFWIANSADGLVVNTTVTMTSGSTALTVGAPLHTYSGPYQLPYRWKQLWLQNNPGFFTSTDRGTCVVGPLGNGGGVRWDTSRLYISQVMDTNNVLLQTGGHDSADIMNANPSDTLSFGGQMFCPIDATANSDVWFEMPDGSIFQTKITAYTDLTHATMADPAPATVTGQVIPMFLGVMGMRWTDTGMAVNATANTGVMSVEWKGNYLQWGYSTDMLPVEVNEVDFFHFLERFGGLYQPLIFAWGNAGPYEIDVYDMYCDYDFIFQQTCTPWDLRSTASANSDEMYGGGGHSGSRYKTEVVDLICAANNFTMRG